MSWYDIFLFMSYKIWYYPKKKLIISLNLICWWGHLIMPNFNYQYELICFSKKKQVIFIQRYFNRRQKTKQVKWNQHVLLPVLIPLYISFWWFVATKITKRNADLNYRLRIVTQQNFYKDSYTDRAHQILNLFEW